MIVLCVAFSGKMPLIFNATFASRLTQISTIQSRLESNSFRFFYDINNARYGERCAGRLLDDIDT